MANYLIGLDFGTSQTKICLLNKDSGVREFIRFDNGSYFLPSLIIRKNDNTFSYGNESISGIKYRYFKMSAAEDEDLIQATNEDLEGNIIGNLSDFKKYSTISDITPEILVILYLTYIILYVKKQKENNMSQAVGGLLGQLTNNNRNTENTFSINLGIPTEWGSPDLIKRKIKFQTLLITSIKLANKFKKINVFLATNQKELLNDISDINRDILEKLNNKSKEDKHKIIENLLNIYKLSVFPESAAGVNYLLKTRRLGDGAYATLDIGAGTSDIAIFEVRNNELTKYFCSESTSIASNDFYREYAKKHFNTEIPTFDEIKNIETIIREDKDVNEDFYLGAQQNIKGFRNGKGIEFIIRKTFYRKYYHSLCSYNRGQASRVKNEILRDRPIIVFGGGANIEGFSDDIYRYYQGSDLYGNHDRGFEAKPIMDYVRQVDIADENRETMSYMNLLILALGLTYTNQDNDFIHIHIRMEDLSEGINNNQIIERYFYYDLQDAAYK